jgi:hypothetical protein
VLAATEGSTAATAEGTTTKGLVPAATEGATTEWLVAAAAKGPRSPGLTTTEGTTAEGLVAAAAAKRPRSPGLTTAEGFVAAAPGGAGEHAFIRSSLVEWLLRHVNWRLGRYLLRRRQAHRSLHHWWA